MAVVMPPPEMRLPSHFQKKRPILDTLASRPTFILKEPIIAKLLREHSFQEVITVSPFEVIKEKWGKKLAAGVVDKMVAEMERRGVKVPPAFKEAMIEAWATIVTRGLLE